MRAVVGPDTELTLKRIGLVNYWALAGQNNYLVLADRILSEG